MQGIALTPEAAVKLVLRLLGKPNITLAGALAVTFGAVICATTIAEITSATGWGLEQVVVDLERIIELLEEPNVETLLRKVNPALLEPILAAMRDDAEEMQPTAAEPAPAS